MSISEKTNPQLQAIKQRFGIIGNSKLLETALDTAVLVAATDLSVLISGESGVGKEVFSKIIHSLSPRKHNQFIAINCGAIPEGTINSELFGHEKGSFTGAANERKGYFETVDGGTIFLDEIGEMPLDTQAMLLRVLESGEFIRVGSSKVLTTNVRVIAATNVKLEDQLYKGKFREDLYYRLNTVPIRIPSLKERSEDIPLLFRKFSTDIAEKYRMQSIQLEEDAKRLLEGYSWPGNIRELKNVAEQVSVLSQARIITADKILEYFPNLLKRNLPAFRQQDDVRGSEREILYKLLFDMKNDMNDLKSLVYELINSNNLRVDNPIHFKQLQSPYSTYKERFDSGSEYPEYKENEAVYDLDMHSNPVVKPIILDKPAQQHLDKTEVVEESLSLEEMEKGQIVKALKKHGGRRKEASDDLGISERTLYRKIKQYGLPD
jgi:DNA-binding NtrC family response regulator